jgi:hypothetical protein
MTRGDYSEDALVEQPGATALQFRPQQTPPIARPKPPIPLNLSFP